MSTTSTLTTATEPVRLRQVTFDAYRDIHKAIRSELFAVTTCAGRVDVSDELDVVTFTSHLDSVVRLLAEHAEHEDDHIQPILHDHLPELAETIELDHARFESRIARVAAVANEIVGCRVAERRFAVHEIYVELAAFVSGYLAHQDLEERVVMPALEDLLGVPGVIDIHMAIIGSMPPDQLMRGLAVMFPTLNVDDRTEMLAGIRAGAPAEVFDAMWGLARSVLTDGDAAKVAARLGLPN